VDSFSASPKLTIPDYARSVLLKAKMFVRPVKPTILPTTLKNKDAINWEKNTQPFPFEMEESIKQYSGKQEEDLPDGKSEDIHAITDSRPQPENRPSEPYVISNKESKTAHLVLLEFFKQNNTLFELSDQDIKRGLPNLEHVNYTSGKYFKRLTYQQMVPGGQLHNGKTLALFDHNFNVISVSRIIITPQKMVSILRGKQGKNISKDQAVELSMKTIIQRLKKDKRSALKVTEATLGVDAVRGIYTWKTRVIGADQYYSDLTLTLNAMTGELLNISDNIDRYTDANINRWGYSSGDFTAPVRYNSTNFYTRDDNTLVHDFFHVVNDNRNNGDSLHNCSDTPQQTQTESAAYGTTSGSNYIRPTRRSDRDYSAWWPGESSGAFGETHVYYWSRWFMQWIKSALNDLGALPNNAADYPRVLLITNSCNSGVGVHNSSFSVSTYQNIGESTNTIRFPERCRSSNGSCSTSNYSNSNSDHLYTFEGNAGYPAPGVIHHELNHFVMKRYMGIESGKDCGAYEELKFLHEGAAGRSLPQAYWHNYYGTGYAPTNTNRQYRADNIAGRPHTNNSNLNKRSDFPCTDEVSSYEAGSVVHQAMWKFYHGIKVAGSTQSSIPRTSTDRDFLVLYYWAADLVSSSTYQDRYEMANRVMEIMENHSDLSSSGKGDWCDVWDTHELDNFILSSYCN
jgi:hypothetical protein